MSDNQKSDDQKQATAFRKAARELGADASNEQFQDTLRKVATAKPLERPKSDKARANNRRD
jgi:hypothetical protein